MYIARAVSTGHSGGWWKIPDTPTLDSAALEAYTKIHGMTRYKRYELSHEDCPEPSLTAISKGPQSTVHSAYHDAESVYWVLVVFLLCALPAGCKFEEDKHQYYFSSVFSTLHRQTVGEKYDTRMSAMPESPPQAEEMLHEGLATLGAFLFQMTRIIRPEYAFLKPNVPPDHLHEAMQRLLLQQIFAMADDPIPLESTTRQLKRPIKFHGEPHTTSGIKRETGESSGSRKRGRVK